MALGVKTNYGTLIKYLKILRNHPAKILKNKISNLIMEIMVIDNHNMLNLNFNILKKVIQFNLKDNLH